MRARPGFVGKAECACSEVGLDGTGICPIGSSIKSTGSYSRPDALHEWMIWCRTSVGIAAVMLDAFERYCDQGVGVRSQRCGRKRSIKTPDSGPASLQAMFDSACLIWRMPG